MFTGIKLTVVYAFIAVVAGEFVLSGSGFGYQIAFAYNNFDNPTMYGLMLLMLVFVGDDQRLAATWPKRVCTGASEGRRHEHHRHHATARSRGTRTRWMRCVVLIVVLVALWQIAERIARPRCADHARAYRAARGAYRERCGFPGEPVM